jgi:hypothetical protein
MGMAKRLWPQIVVHILRNLEGGETSLTESSSGRLEFKLGHIRLTGSVELRSDRCSGLVLFDQSCRMDRLKLQIRQDRKWKVKFMINKITRRSIIQLQIVWHNQMFKYFEITLEASDIILLIFSSSF